MAGVGLFSVSIANAATLNVGGNYGHLDVIFNGTEENAGTGSIAPSTLDGRTLPFLYCLDLEHNIGVPGTYSSTVSTNGTIWDASYGPVNLNASVLSGNKNSGPVQLSLTQAGQIAYLLDHYGYTATTMDQQEALQGAIWKEIYGNAITLGPSADANQIADYNAYLTNVGIDPVSNMLWISPTDSGGTYQQAQITTAVPEPGAVTLFASFGVAGFGLLARKKRASHRAAANH